MAKPTKTSSEATGLEGRAWVWVADGLGLALGSALATAAAGAPILTQAHGWLMLALPLAGLVAIVISDRGEPAAPVVTRAVARRTIVITPRLIDIRTNL